MTKYRGTVVLDLDSTIGDLETPLNYHLNELTGKKLSVDDWYKFDTVGVYGITDEDFYNCIIKNQLLENMQPYPETKALLTNLYRKGYNVNIITSRAYHPKALKVTIGWFAKYDIPFSRIVVNEHGKKKSDYINEEENVVLFVDDRIENCQDFINSGKAKNVMLFDQPWNRSSNINRIKNLNELKPLFNM